MKTLQTFILVIAALALASCGGKTRGLSSVPVLYQPRYASGFTVRGDSTAATIEVRAPWQGADSTTVSTLTVRRGQEPRRIVTMSTSYIGMLDLLDATDRVAGVSGLQYVSNDGIRLRSDVADIGFEGNIDYERLVSLRPDLVLLYGIDSPSLMEPKLKELGIPYLYMGEYVEQSPLGKAEWTVAMGYIIGKPELARQKFEAIAEKYNTLGAEARQATKRPRVMLNTPYSDSWVMPSVTNYMARLIADAGGEYVYARNTGNASRPIDMEEAYTLAARADYWLNVGSASTMDELLEMCPKFADVAPVTGGRVFNNILRATPGGGNDFWESGVVSPQLVLADMIEIFNGREPQYYYVRLK